MSTEEPDKMDGVAEFTQQEILDTFEKLGLTDPDVQRRMAQLSNLDKPQRPVYWTVADSGTSLIDSQ